MTDTPVPEGIEAAGVTAWFEAHAADVVPPLRFSLIAGGRSNFTYTVTDSAGQRFVLRRPPLGPLLPSAHDMSREHRVIAALGSSPVPVPPIVGLCTDEAVTGAPFYVMRFVDGLILRDPQAVTAVPERIRVAASEALVDVLADLHAVDPDAIGLGDLGRKDGYVERTLRRWRGQWEKSKNREIPLVEEVADRLAADIPTAGPARIVHGDYRLDNAIVSGDDGSVQAVLDWELCTLGDPLADLGMLLVYWTEPGDEMSALSWAPTVAPGFPGRKEVVARYAASSGRDLAELDYYVALGYWKIAVILEGVYVRYAAGAYGETDDSWRAFETTVPQLAEAAHEAAPVAPVVEVVTGGPRVLVTRPLPAGGTEPLVDPDGPGPPCEVIQRAEDEPLDPAGLAEAVGAGVDGVICLLTERIDADVLAAGKGRLRVVANVAVGFDNIDVEAATAAGVVVCNTPGILDETTADLAFLLILAAARRTSEAEAVLRAGRWTGFHIDEFLGTDVHGATLGLVGYGRIGRAVARRAEGFAMEVVHHTRTPTGEPGWVGHLHDLLRGADIVSVHVPLTPATRHLIGRPELALMKRTAVLVNTARGPVVDEEALAEALETGVIAAAGLDVFEAEPLVHPRLLTAPGAVLLPHIGSASVATRTAMARLASASARALLAGEMPPTALNPEAAAAL